MEKIDKENLMAVALDKKFNKLEARIKKLEGSWAIFTLPSVNIPKTTPLNPEDFYPGSLKMNNVLPSPVIGVEEALRRAKHFYNSGDYKLAFEMLDRVIKTRQAAGAEEKERDVDILAKHHAIPIEMLKPLVEAYEIANNGEKSDTDGALELLLDKVYKLLQAWGMMK